MSLLYEILLVGISLLQLQQEFTYVYRQKVEVVQWLNVIVALIILTARKLQETRFQSVLQTVQFDFYNQVFLSTLDTGICLCCVHPRYTTKLWRMRVNHQPRNVRYARLRLVKYEKINTTKFRSSLTEAFHLSLF